MKRFLCLRLPLWPIQRLTVARPELEACPLVLHVRDVRQVERVVACSPAASSSDAIIGMPLGEALAIYQRETGNAAGSPQLVAIPHDPAADQLALEQLAERCEAFSPLGGWDPLDAPATPALDYLLLDITGIAPLFGGEEPLARQVARACAALGYRPRIAIAETMGGSWALTTEPAAEIQVVPVGQLAAALDPLSVGALRLGSQATQLLAQLGILQIADLLRLPRGGLATRFGQQFLLRLDRVLGTAADSLVPFRPPPAFEVQWRLEHPTEHPEILAHLLQRLLERLAAALTRQQQGVLRLECRLEGEFAPPAAWQIGLYRPAATADYLWSLLRVPFEQQKLRGEVNRIHLQASLTAPLQQQQQHLFADSLRSANRELATLLDRLGSRLGLDALVRPQPIADSLPERAFAYVAVIGHEGARAPRRKTARGRASEHAPPAASGELRAAMLRPLTLLKEPQPLSVLVIAPAGPPQSFLFRGNHERVVRHWGPERIETGWQRGHTIRRDYFRVETASGQWFWIFRELPAGRWFLQGLFD